MRLKKTNCGRKFGQNQRQETNVSSRSSALASRRFQRVSVFAKMRRNFCLASERMSLFYLIGAASLSQGCFGKRDL